MTRTPKPSPPPSSEIPQPVPLRVQGPPAMHYPPYGCRIIGLESGSREPTPPNQERPVKRLGWSGLEEAVRRLQESRNAPASAPSPSAH